MQWAGSRARNHPIVLSTLLYRKMANSIEDMLKYLGKVLSALSALSPLSGLKPGEEVCCTSIENGLFGPFSPVTPYEALIYHLVRNRPAKASII